MKWNKLESWQLLQLERMAELDPERIETVLNTIWKSYPGLLEDMAISAVDQEQLSIEGFAAQFMVSEEEVEAKLIAFRNRTATAECAVIATDGKHFARLSGTQFAVWEIVREFRKLGSVESLQNAFPSLTHSELAGALRYAQDHSAEIERNISDYEELVARRRAEYPFAK